MSLRHMSGSIQTRVYGGRQIRKVVDVIGVRRTPEYSALHDCFDGCSKRLLNNRLSEKAGPMYCLSSGLVLDDCWRPQ